MKTPGIKVATLSIFFIYGLALVSFGQKMLDNHIEAIEQFSRVKSKSKSLVSYAKRNMKGTAGLDTAELMYMDLKEICDGAISKYCSIIDNPKQAKKTESTITSNLNEMNLELGRFSTFITSRAQTNLGFGPSSPILLITTFTGLGANLLKEISDMKKAKRDATKKEVEQYRLEDWVLIE